MTSVVLVEDHDMVAEAIGQALERAGFTVIARASSVATALAEIVRGRPDVVLLDRRLPDGDGTALIPEFVRAGAKVLVLTGEATASVAARVAEAGGAGLILKSARLDDLVEAVRKVAAGEVVFDSRLLAGVLDRLTGRVKAAGASLTAREQETLLLLADGAGTDQISTRLGVARNTARNHVQRVLDKLGARSQLEAVSIARREGLLD
ncbi:response regulator transcription factor [Lentzea sp. NBC_00516]|uniref:response regulator transcription factor n=1 Tax=Lentzea sp. NBC_00516 TaxID=2903582 RepID=UPI002E811BAA|nr:response regulator transcription factor [Lentzea sp. NBC_00516]WUD23944.1 response regulator transcription factor [Lentzea sp. NBC_00516]